MIIITENMTSEAVDRAIEDARETETEIHLKDPNGKASHNEIKWNNDNSFAGSFLAIFTQLLSLDLVFGRENKILINKIYRKKIYKIDILSKGIRSKFVFMLWIYVLKGVVLRKLIPLELNEE